MDDDLNKITEWLTATKLTLNESKTSLCWLVQGKG